MAGQTSVPRRPVLAASHDTAFGLCADIGGTFIKFAALQAGGTLGATVRLPTPAKDWPAFCAALQGLCEDVDESAALSLSIAGVVDPDSGLALSANVPCISGRRLTADLAAGIGRPVIVANDADCFVLAESLRGAGRGQRVVFGIILGSGVGGGLVVEGRIVEGAGGIAGEWGHGPIVGTVRVGPVEIPPFPCGCGQSGCLDTIGSARGLERIDDLLHGETRGSRAIVEAWTSTEAAASRTVDVWTDMVAGPLAVMVNATGAGVVPVGGGLANSHALIGHLDAAVRRRILRRTAAPIVVPSQLGDDAGLIGAALRLGPPSPSPAEAETIPA